MARRRPRRSRARPGRSPGQWQALAPQAPRPPRAGGLAARDHELAHAFRRERARHVAKRLLDGFAAPRRDLPGRRARVDEWRGFQVARRPVHGGRGIQFMRIELEGGRRPGRDLSKRRLRAAAGEDDCRTAEPRQGLRGRASLSERACDAHGKPRAAGRERHVPACLAGGDKVLVANGVEHGVTGAFPELFESFRIASGPASMTSEGTRPTSCGVCAASTRTRFESRIGVSG